MAMLQLSFIVCSHIYGHGI